MFVKGAYLGILFVILGASLNLVTAQGKKGSETITPDTRIILFIYKHFFSVYFLLHFHF